MIAIENTLISRDLFQTYFSCNLARCKGACCVAGDKGAPLEKEETLLLKENYAQISSYMSTEGKKAVEEQGLYSYDEDEQEYITPLINKKECAYVVFEQGIAKCAIEKAYAENKSSIKKPISCHLYPVRITRYEDFDAINYHEWKETCSSACEAGRELKIPLYQFVKEALIRKYGKDWMDQLEYAANNLNKLIK